MSTSLAYYKDKRKFMPAIKASLLWLRNPVSEDGAKQLFRIMYNVLGPEIHRITRHMRRDPQFSKILENKSDLGKILADMDSLKKLPEGSLGKFYHDFMSGDDIFPGYILGGLAYRDGHFDALVDWEEDAKFLVQRIGNIHDISHLLGGYGTDLSGEALQIAFTVGANGFPNGMPVGLASVFGVFFGILDYPVFRPKVGFFKWVSMFRDAARRGAIMAKKNTLLQIHYEELLHLPLKEVREKLGVPLHKHQDYVNDDGFLASRDWMQGWLGKQFETGFGSMEKTLVDVNRARTLIENGFSVHDVMSAPRENIIDAHEQFLAGHDKEKILSDLTNYHYA